MNAATSTASSGAGGGVPIVFACDNGYGMQLATAMRSLVEANRRWWPLTIHVLADGIAAETRAKVQRSLPEGSATVQWIDVDADRFGKFTTMGHVSRVTFARLLMPQFFPATISRVLYLDADLLVLGDLSELWSMDLEGAILGAVTDGLDARMKSGLTPRHAAGQVQHYLNAGVLLLDLERWRRDRIGEKALEFLRQNPTTDYADQDALNVVCDGAWKLLDRRWNTQLDTGDKSITNVPDVPEPAIAHFVWNQKPWTAKVLNVNARIFDDFRSRTAFARSSSERLRDTLEASWARLERALRPLRHGWKR